MIIGDKSLRRKAIPFEALPFATVLPGGMLDLGPDGGSVTRINAIALTRPYSGDLAEARLTMSLTAPASEGFSMRIAVGTFNDANLTDYPNSINTSYTEEYINQSHLRITGRTTPYSVSAGGTLFIDELDILPQLPKRGDVDFVPDGFVLLFILSVEPSAGDEFVLNTFRVLCSAQMGLL